MSLMLRILCVGGSLVTLLFITSNIRRRKVQIEDSIFWVVLAAALLVVAVFPRIATFASTLLGFQAPSNFVFVVVIAILLAKLFSLSTEVSSLKHRLNELAQEEALLSKEEEENSGARNTARCNKSK